MFSIVRGGVAKRDTHAAREQRNRRPGRLPLAFLLSSFLFPLWVPSQACGLPVGWRALPTSMLWLEGMPTTTPGEPSRNIPHHTLGDGDSGVYSPTAAVTRTYHAHRTTPTLGSLNSTSSISVKCMLFKVLTTGIQFELSYSVVDFF